MDYFIYASASLAILAALTSLLVTGRDGWDGRRARGSRTGGPRTVSCGFAVAGVGVIALIGALLPSFHKVFDFGVIGALGAVMVVLGVGYAVGASLVATARKQRRKPRPARAIPRLSDL